MHLPDLLDELVALFIECSPDGLGDVVEFVRQAQDLFEAYGVDVSTAASLSWGEHARTIGTRRKRKVLGEL